MSFEGSERSSFNFLEVEVSAFIGNHMNYQIKNGEDIMLVLSENEWRMLFRAKYPLERKQRKQTWEHSYKFCDWLYHMYGDCLLKERQTEFPICWNNYEATLEISPIYFAITIHYGLFNHDGEQLSKHPIMGHLCRIFHRMVTNLQFNSQTRHVLTISSDRSLSYSRSMLVEKSIMDKDKYVVSVIHKIYGETGDDILVLQFMRAAMNGTLQLDEKYFI